MAISAVSMDVTNKRHVLGSLPEIAETRHATKNAQLSYVRFLTHDHDISFLPAYGPLLIQMKLGTGKLISCCQR
jgi:hypothetical protein